jgi:tetratricopeptide (TPR) repeat protein
MRNDTQRRLRYASGYTELRMFAEAAREIQGVAVEDRFAPEVLTAQVNLCVETKAWEKAVTIGRCLATRAPELEAGWISCAYALRELGRIGEARDCLLEAEPRHGATSAVLHYNLACYYSLLGEPATARERLQRACKMEPRFKAEALEDRDLEALRNFRAGE